MRPTTLGLRDSPRFMRRQLSKLLIDTNVKLKSSKN
jgi:hypothetical protein